jgi:hypothetical protein
MIKTKINSTKKRELFSTVQKYISTIVLPGFKMQAKWTRCKIVPKWEISRISMSFFEYVICLRAVFHMLYAWYFQIAVSWINPAKYGTPVSSQRTSLMHHQLNAVLSCGPSSHQQDKLTCMFGSAEIGMQVMHALSALTSWGVKQMKDLEHPHRSQKRLQEQRTLHSLLVLSGNLDLYKVVIRDRNGMWEPKQCTHW